MKLGKPDKVVETQFKRAQDLARKQGAMTFEIRAAMDLARLWNEQGRSKEALSILQESYALIRLTC